ncbi:MAG: hypothetical protein D4R65_15280 [Verrucomicrobiaceae bacterium]|nr:MAG: hypothetical protein D4R65_15280 [Verrucomicrobiaceae bacterium]
MIARILPLLFLAAGLFHPARAATFEELNTAFGIPLWTDDNLWDDDAAETAKRLGWPEESLTTTDSSYRKYPRANDVVLGTRPYSLALYGEKGSVNGISMMFANKGDAVDSNTGPIDVKQARERTKAIKDFKAAIVADKNKLESALTATLGQPVADKFGQGTQTRESVKRWDWNGHAILLAAPRDEYAAIRVLPSAAADLQGKSRIPDAELRERLASRIEKRANGDVILKDIPMVDQGPKGYCVPATWERVMRYMGIPADMYVLAMAGDTDAGGGTSIAAIAAGAKEAITRGGRQLAVEAGKVNVLNVKKRISHGLPIMWGVSVDREFDNSLFGRTKERSQMSDPKAWDKNLAEARKAAKKIRPNPMNGHVRMIIGYNETTGEIAFSDSWGPPAAERWMTQEEAQAISQGGYQFINF